MTISGQATPVVTRGVAHQFSQNTYHPLGATGLTVSAAGFGGYRISTGVPAHAEALENALAGGINLIDTSANYADGGSETIVGAVLDKLIKTGRVSREQVVIVSKGGYIQGANDAVIGQREAGGRPFEEIVDYADGLRHCIHPDFLADQIGRSLERLGLETIDAYLLHNPEYYLGWAHKKGPTLKNARAEYYRRIEQAFIHLEHEVNNGRIQYYGISSNTFPAGAEDVEFTCLHKVWAIAQAISPDHHFRIIQLPFNLFETGAVLEPNQPNGQTVLDAAHGNQLGVLVNRPLNAFTRRQMVRLASIGVRSRLDYKEIIDRIKQLAHSEARLWRKLLPEVETIPGGIKVRIKQQLCFAESLKHHWRSFGSYERWREAQDGIFLPRIQGVMTYLDSYADDHSDLADWMQSHEKTVGRALHAVASIYADDAIAREKKILAAVAQADDDWAGSGTLSRKAMRALMSTTGVSTVLVGMRKKAYVREVLTEIGQPVSQADRTDSWKRLQDGLASLHSV